MVGGSTSPGYSLLCFHHRERNIQLTSTTYLASALSLHLMEPYCFSPLPSGLHETRQVRGSPRFPRTKMSEVEEDGGARCEDKLTEVSLPDFKLQKARKVYFR